MLSQYKRATDLMVTHKDALKRIADALIEYETLEADEITALMEGRAITREPPKVKMTTREEMDKRLQLERDRKKADAPPGAPLGPVLGEPSKA